MPAISAPIMAEGEKIMGDKGSNREKSKKKLKKKPKHTLLEKRKIKKEKKVVFLAESV